MKPFLASLLVLIAPIAHADAIRCNMSEYKPSEGLTASPEQDRLTVSWTGERDIHFRLSLAIDAGTPIMRELAIQGKSRQWTILGRDLKPEFHVVAGVRRVTEQQLQPLRQLGINITPEVLEREKWYAFWDAPLNIPGVEAGKPPSNPNLPRRREEIRRATATYNAAGCDVKTNGARLEISFPGLSMGIFSGQLQYTVYKGANLLRLEAIAKTEEPSVAYKYRAALKGFSIADFGRLIWRDTGNNWQAHQFGGAKNEEPVPLKASGRLAILEGKTGSMGFFPPPHTFFFAREVETNLGYVWYRKDDEKSFSVGVRQGDREEVEKYRANFALYNAPPGTWQRMPVYFYWSPRSGHAVHKAAMAFTRGDHFKALPGYKTMVNHFHVSFTDRLRESGSLDTLVQELPAMKSVGINIVTLSDFHSDKLHPRDPGPLRLADQKDYFEAARRHSDKDFLIIPGEEPNAYLGGHYNIVFPKPMFWTLVRQPGQPLVENATPYGKVYHTGSAADVLEMVKRESGLIWQAHPRTKGSTGYPDAIHEKDYFRSDHFLGAAFKPGMGMDLSEKRLCEYRCLDLLDDMNNWISDHATLPKFLFADCDTYQKQPGDDLYANFPVNYVKLDRVPSYDEDWSSILRAVRAGNFFVSTGEILFRNYAVEGSGSMRTIVADLEWTFPLEFVEVVWGDGRKTDRQIISATDLRPFGNHRFRLPFDASGKKWVRFAVWDSAGNGAFVNPVLLKSQTGTASR